MLVPNEEHEDMARTSLSPKRPPPGADAAAGSSGSGSHAAAARVEEPLRADHKVIP